MNPEDFYLNDNVETFNDVIEEDFSPQILIMTIDSNISKGG